MHLQTTGLAMAFHDGAHDTIRMRSFICCRVAVCGQRGRALRTTR